VPTLDLFGIHNQIQAKVKAQSILPLALHISSFPVHVVDSKNSQLLVIYIGSFDFSANKDSIVNTKADIMFRDTNLISLRNMVMSLNSNATTSTANAVTIKFNLPISAYGIPIYSGLPLSKTLDSKTVSVFIQHSLNAMGL
jgi:hypothetical protein